MEIAPRQLILSLYGLYAREEGDWLSVASLIALMADLGADSAAVRSSVSRLKRRGMLEAAQREGRAGYALAPSTLELLREGDHRIWSRPRATAADGWLVLVFSVPEAERDRRHALRSLLAGLGFGTAAPGVWVAPATLYDETLRALDRTGLTSYTEFFRGDYLGAGDVSARMREWWDVDALTGSVRRVLRRVAARRPGGAPRRRPPRRSRRTSRCSPRGAGSPTSTPVSRSNTCRATGRGSRRARSSRASMDSCATTRTSTRTGSCTHDPRTG